MDKSSIMSSFSDSNSLGKVVIALTFLMKCPEVYNTEEPH